MNTNSWANHDTWSAKISFTFYSRTTMRTSWRKLVRPGRPVLLPISHSVVRRGGGRGRGISFFRNPICIYNGSDVNASPSHARIRWKHRWYGNYDTFFSLFFLFLFLFLFPFLFFSAQERSTNYYYLFFWPPMISNTLSLFKSFKWESRNDFVSSKYTK